jgi:LysM repeat protein
MLVKNPNYNPNDRNSKRFIDAGAANIEAQNKQQEIANPTVTPTPRTVNVVAGDTLGAIARNNNTTVNELARINNIANPNLINVGQQIRLPGVINNQQNTAVPQAPASQTFNIQEFAEQSGKAGLDLDTFAAAASRGVTENDRQGIRDSLGITELSQNVFSKPEQSTQDIYNELFNSVGLRNVQKNIAKLDEDIAQKREDLTEAIGKIEGNPFISQATRTGRLGQLQRQAELTIGNLLDERQAFVDQYDSGVSEIERTLGFIQDDFQLEKELGAEQLNFLLGEAEAQEDAIREEELQNALRFTPDFLKGVESSRQQTIADELRLINARRDADIAVKNAGIVQPIINTVIDTPEGKQDITTLRNALASASLTLSTDARDNALDQFDNLLAQGNLPAAREFVINVAVAGESSEIRSKVLGREEALDSLAAIRQSLEEYKAAGGKTNILAGGYEDILNKLGTTTDPNLAKIEISIRQSIQAYRKAISGAAFTESESKEYEALFPSKSSTNELNNAKIDALEEGFLRNQNTFLRTRLGTEGAAAVTNTGGSQVVEGNTLLGQPTNVDTSSINFTFKN